MADNNRDLALFTIAIDCKHRGCDLVCALLRPTSTIAISLSEGIDLQNSLPSDLPCADLARSLNLPQRPSRLTGYCEHSLVRASSGCDKMACADIL